MADEIQLPIEHISYSALKSYCSNQQQFFKNYVLGIFDKKSSPAMAIGKAFHKSLEHYYRTSDFEKGVEIGMMYLAGVKDTDIDFGKTGSRETMLRDFNRAINFYRNAEPNLGNIQGVEVSVTTDEGFEGEPLPLPVKAVSDVVSIVGDDLEIFDYKVVTSFTDKEDEQPDYIMQALFNFLTVKSKFKKAPKRMTFIEVKKSENKDGTEQLQLYKIEFESHPEYKKFLYNIYANFIRALADPEKVYLPNFADSFTGKESWKDFTAGVIDFSAVPKVSHRTDLTKVRTIDYVDSELESNKAITEEEKIRIKLQEFGIPVSMDSTHKGLNVTLYTMKPSRGVKMSQFESRGSDLQFALEAKSVRMQAPIPGTGLVGVEVSNKDQGSINWKKEIVIKNEMNIPIGVDVYGDTHMLDLTKAPHLLIGGTTGSGKSVFMNVVIRSLTEAMSPEKLQMVLIDPKRTEFLDYEDLPHLASEILTESADVEASLRWLVEQMEERYQLLRDARVKTIQDYNSNNVKQMPYIVVVIDELADLMLENATMNGTQMTYKESIERSIVRLAQKARAAGIHLVVATQRPSVDVVTGLIKANFPTRVSFAVSSSTDSRVILDDTGAETLIGNGDLLYMYAKNQKLVRLQGYFIK